MKSFFPDCPGPGPFDQRSPRCRRARCCSSPMPPKVAPATAAAPAAATPAAPAPAPAAAPTKQQTKWPPATEAGDKKGDERKAFMKSCLSNKPATQQDKMKACNADPSQDPQGR